MALKLRDHFGGSAHLPRCYSLGCRRCNSFNSISEALPERFLAGDTLVCIMAAGIVFRVLAPYLKSKQDDPAVIVLDEEGRHVIPLLGGHAAGANDLAVEIANFLGAEAAITTASDVQSLIAPDQVARMLNAAVDNQVDLRRITALLVDGKRVCIEAACNPGIAGYAWVPPGGDLTGYEGRLEVTWRVQQLQEVESRAVVPTARLIPRVVVAGVGCRRGTPAAKIIQAITVLSQKHGVDPRAIGTLASVDAKRNEPGLTEAATKLDAELLFFSPDELKTLNCPGSTFVEEQVGTPAVCEPAALLAAGDEGKLLASKTKVGSVTVALAVKPLPGEDGSAVASSPGRVLVVGTGGGTALLMTEEARRAIHGADVVIGYRTYVEQLRQIFPHKTYISGSMGDEINRCRQALDLAGQGHTVALVSSGDPGVYGMAGPILEMTNGIPVSIIPGVTAAQLAAARLGAPLMNDYVTLSLSDLLVPREEVLKRLRQAAASDLVICLYNPTSKKRQPLFEEACAILATYRPPETPVGWVRDAGGAAEEVHLTRLRHLASQKIDMRTIIIVGNLHTQIINGKMVTRRGYERKSDHSAH